jgi:hypothetical protein
MYSKGETSKLASMLVPDPNFRQLMYSEAGFQVGAWSKLLSINVFWWWNINVHLRDSFSKKLTYSILGIALHKINSLRTQCTQFYPHPASRNTISAKLISLNQVRFGSHKAEPRDIKCLYFLCHQLSPYIALFCQSAGFICALHVSGRRCYHELLIKNNEHIIINNGLDHGKSNPL